MSVTAKESGIPVLTPYVRPKVASKFFDQIDKSWECQTSSVAITEILFKFIIITEVDPPQCRGGVLVFDRASTKE
jgi:hypothetical protein